MRLALPGQHHEAITSRPLLLTSVGRMTKHGGQKKIVVTSMHGNITKLARACCRLNNLFNGLKRIAPQLTIPESWQWMLANIIDSFGVKTEVTGLPEPCLLI